MPPDEGKEPVEHASVRGYLLLCLLSLLVLGVTLMGNGAEWWAFLLVLFGLVLLLLRWNLGPVFLLLGFTALVTYQARNQRYYLNRVESDIGSHADLCACLAVLVYVAGSYRLQSLLREVFPGEERGGRKARRDPDAVRGVELPLLLLTLPVWVIGAFLIWLLLPEDTRLSEAPLDIPSRLWRLLVLVLLLLPLLAVVSVLGRYLAANQASLEESQLYLQDQVWRGTRREQSRLNRWLVWARRRAQKRKEGT
jgi:hypothetical protein